LSFFWANGWIANTSLTFALITRLMDQIFRSFFMAQFFTTDIGRLRLIAFLEGISLLFLVFVAVPFKYFLENPFLVKSIGPIHGVLFLLFIFYALRISIEYDWNFKKTTWKVLLSSLVPFGTFYIDSKILKNMGASVANAK